MVRGFADPANRRPTGLPLAGPLPSGQRSSGREWRHKDTEDPNDSDSDSDYVPEDDEPEDSSGSDYGSDFRTDDEDIGEDEDMGDYEEFKMAIDTSMAGGSNDADNADDSDAGDEVDISPAQQERARKHAALEVERAKNRARWKHGRRVVHYPRVMDLHNCDGVDRYEVFEQETIKLFTNLEVMRVFGTSLCFYKPLPRTFMYLVRDDPMGRGNLYLHPTRRWGAQSPAHGRARVISTLRCSTSLSSAWCTLSRCATGVRGGGGPRDVRARDQRGSVFGSSCWLL